MTDCYWCGLPPGEHGPFCPHVTGDMEMAVRLIEANDFSKGKKNANTGEEK